MKASLTVYFEDPFWVGVFERITNKTIILSAILMAICLLLSGCGGKSTFDGSRTSDETVCCLYHQKKEFISVPYEPKDASHLKQC